MQGGRFNIDSVLLLTIQMIDMLEHLHSRHIVHCDIKPDNLLFGNPRDSSTAGQLHLVDFGFARYYRNPVSKVLRPCLNDQKMIGTRYYSSVNLLQGIAPSPRDDLESLAYTILRLLRCSAPWDDCTERGEKVIKTNITGAVLFDGLPREFGQLFNHAHELRYDQQPDYQFLKGIFRSRARAIGVQPDELFNNHSAGIGSMVEELVKPSWPTVEQYSELDDESEEEEEVEDGIGPDWDGYISVTSWLLQDGVPEQDLFGDENKMLEGKVDVIAKPPTSDSRNECVAAVEEVILMEYDSACHLTDSMSPL
jgi:casein kinase I family protein HRR25